MQAKRAFPEMLCEILMMFDEMLKLFGMFRLQFTQGTDGRKMC